MRRFGSRELLKLVGNYRGYRRVFARECIFDLLGRFTPVIAVDSRGHRYFVSTADKGIGRDVFARGFYGDRDEMKVVLDFLARTAGHPDTLRHKTFLDIGANIGTSTIAALVEFEAASAISVEPHPHNFTLLQHNLLANKLIDRVRPLQLALSDVDGQVELELAKLNQGDCRVRVKGRPAATAYREDKRGLIQVNAMTLDRLMLEGTVDPDQLGLVWIDTQGHEAHVLAGAQQLLRSDVPLVIEYWPYGLRNAYALQRLHKLVIDHYTWFVDTYDSSSLELRPAAAIVDLPQTYGTSPLLHTNLLLLKQRHGQRHRATAE